MIFETDWIKLLGTTIFRDFVDYINLNKSELSFMEIYYKITRGNEGIIKFGISIKPDLDYNYFLFVYNGFDSHGNLSPVKLKIEQKTIEAIDVNTQALIVKTRILRTMPNKFLQLRFFRTGPLSTSIPLNKIILTGEQGRENENVSNLALLTPEQLNFDHVRYIL
jgi:hypothetical protein